jgi:hypothetical protein
MIEFLGDPNVTREVFGFFIRDENDSIGGAYFSVVELLVLISSSSEFSDGVGRCTEYLQHNRGNSQART